MSDRLAGAAPVLLWCSCRASLHFDWSGDWAILCGERTRLSGGPYQAVAQPGVNRSTYLLQFHEMLFDAKSQALRVLVDFPRRGIFDNMKTAVHRIGSGKARQTNVQSAAMASDDLLEPE